MGACEKITSILLISCIYGTLAIPSSIVDEIKARELRPNKVKRVLLPSQSGEENAKNTNHFYGNPTAIKRGTGPKNEGQDTETTVNGDWTPEGPNVFQNPDDDFQSTLYNDGNLQDDKSLSEYEKGFQYATNKEKLDEALENAVLKSEMYGVPSTLNQYRYFDNDKRRRRKRDSRKLNFSNHANADDLTPEEVLALLSLYENERQAYEKPRQDNLDDYEQDNGIWLDVPLRPHSEYPNSIESGYLYGQNPDLDGSRWSDGRDKRFMVSKKSNDPTREIKYLTGPSKHDYYTLSQLLNNQRETNVPVFHRYVL